MARRVSVEIVGNSASVERAFQRSGHAASQWNHDLSRVGRGVAVATVGFRGLGRSIAFASGSFIAGAGLTAALKASVTSFQQFQESMQHAVGLAGVAQTEIGKFSDEILKLAPAVGKTPQELAEGFYFIASSGIAASQAMGVLTQAAKASAAGLGETKTVADAITSVMNAYGAANVSAAKATDILVATVREGKGEAADFAPVIGNVAALASQLGVSFDEVGAALASQTRLGTDAETAAIQLQRVLSSLVKVTPAQGKAFHSVGLDADKLRKKLGTEGGLLKVLTDVQDAFQTGAKGGGNTPALAKAFGDERAIRGVLNLVGKQAEQTAGVFQRVKNSAGSTETALKAVSKTAAQQFRKFQASAEVAKISLGALFAPLAGSAAKALAGATNAVTEFANKIGAQHTTHAKLKIVWSGFQNASRGAVKGLQDAFGKVNWDSVWSHARGISDGLQKRLQAVNWGAVGKRIGDGLAKAVKAAVPAAKDLGVRLTDIFGAVDWVKVGQKMGPGLLTAVLTAISLILDPSFWVHHLDLAFALIFARFGGGLVGKLGRFISKPFIRLGESAVLAMLGAVERLSPKLASFLLDAFLGAGKVVEKEAVKIEKSVQGLFSRLFKRPLRFLIKTLGLKVAIDAVVHGFTRLAHWIEHAFDSVWAKLKKDALKAALAIIEPFTHLPKKLGGGKFQGLKDDFLAQMDGISLAAEKAGRTIEETLGQAQEMLRKAPKSGLIVHVVGEGLDRLQRALDGLKVKPVTAKVAAAGLAEIHRQLDGVKDRKVRVQILQEGIAGIQALLAAVKGKKVTVKVLEQGIRQLRAQMDKVKGKKIEVKVLASGIAALQSQLDAIKDKTITVTVHRGSAGSEDVRDQAVVHRGSVGSEGVVPLPTTTPVTHHTFKPINDDTGGGDKKPKWLKAFEKTLERLQLVVDRAGLTKRLTDDVKAEQGVIDAVKHQLSLHKNNLELQQDLVSAQQTMLGLRKQEKDALDEVKKKQQELLKSAVEGARSAFGELGQGPVLQPTDTQKLLAAGAPLIPADRFSLDLQQQLKQFTAAQKDLATLQKRGAPKALLDQLRAQGQAGAEEAHQLANADPTTLKKFLGVFRQSQRAIQKAARIAIQANHVTVTGPISIHGTGTQIAPRDTSGIKIPGPHGKTTLKDGMGGTLHRGEAVVVHTNVDLDGRTIASVVSKHHGRRDRAGSPQRRGGNAGSNPNL